MASGSGCPVRVAVVDDYEIVVAGLAAALAPYADRVRVVELEVGCRPVRHDVDIVLYDTFGHTHEHDRAIEELAADGSAKVVVFSWSSEPAMVRRALQQGVAGYLVKSLPAAEIVDALERVHAGETVLPDGLMMSPSPDTLCWPGKHLDLSHREAEVLALVAQGLSNAEIACRLYLSVNSVKTYIRTAYRKIDVTRRAQAVRWALEHGLVPEAGRPRATADPPAR